jgi:hypothetical protein
MSDGGGQVADLIWRESLWTADRVPGALDLLDWADRLGEHGAVLRDCAALITGFSRAGPRRSDGVWTVDIASAELAELACGLTLSLSTPALPRPSGRPDSLIGIGPGIPIREPLADPVELASRLVRLLAADALDAPGLAAAVEDALEFARRLPKFDYRRLAAGASDRLAAAIGTAVLAHFAVDVQDLAAAPFGSPELLWRSARLDQGGMGPWFRNVNNVIRVTDDLYDLARFANGSEDEDGWSAWVTLLSRRLPDWRFRHVADDIADYGKTVALDAMLTRALARQEASIGLTTIMYLRDAALDLAAYGIAARAQAAICDARPSEVIEWEILATIQADAGNLAGARGLLLQALLLFPGHAGIKARLETLGTPAFGGFSIARGFASPVDRYETRLALRGALPDYPRRKGHRIPAVQV